MFFVFISCSENDINSVNQTYNPDCTSLSYLSRPNPIDSDNTHNYYEYRWQSDPKICINVYDVSILGGREKKINSSMEWVKLNLPNIVPINVFYIDQYNASQEAKNDFDIDFCNLIREGNEVENCIKESAESWGNRSYGGGVYNTYLHNGADLMIYDDAFPTSGSDETEDTGIRYLMHEYFHTFQTSHFFFFEERNQFGINKENFQSGKTLPFLPIWIGEGSADFASLPLMAKQDLDFDHYERAIRFLDEARTAISGSNSTLSLKDFETENYRVGGEYYAYGGGFMAFVYLWHLNKDNFKKIMYDYYTIFAEKEKLNPGHGWKDAFEESYGITIEEFYLDFDAFMLKDKESQLEIIKSSEEWGNTSWN
mgnify:CR=1 FL=1|jgi:hypothetical protein